MKSAPLLPEQTAIHFTDFQLSKTTMGDNAMKAFQRKTHKSWLNVFFAAFALLSIFFFRRTWSEKNLAIFLSVIAEVPNVSLLGLYVVKLSRRKLYTVINVTEISTSAAFEVSQLLALMSLRIVTLWRCLSWKVTEVLDEIKRKIRTSHELQMLSFVSETIAG